MFNLRVQIEAGAIAEKLGATADVLKHHLATHPVPVDQVSRN